jgi:epoxyqueuosine reductase
VIDLSSRIKNKAREIGFQKIGFAPAEALHTEKSRLESWLSAGFHGEMKWLERDPERRSDPRLLFPEAKTVVALALNYYTPFQHSEKPGTGKVSRYAWGDDYHDVMYEKMDNLLDWVKDEIPGAEGKICCDIQPMMDKAWAVRAGLGWIGKHSNLITKEVGSWVFLGEILLNIELPDAKEPVSDHCGTCRACIDHCPTQAIVEPYIVDSKRCLSYATIELRAPKLPEDITSDLSGWLYGCDVCQDVCPWNRFQENSNESEFMPREGNVSADLFDILSLTQEDYSVRFRKSAMKRTKLSGLQRNARALLGQDPERKNIDESE